MRRRYSHLYDPLFFLHKSLCCLCNIEHLRSSRKSEYYWLEKLKVGVHVDPRVAENLGGHTIWGIPRQGDTIIWRWTLFKYLADFWLCKYEGDSKKPTQKTVAERMKVSRDIRCFSRQKRRLQSEFFQTMILHKLPGFFNYLP